jgi:hypothetical protein
MTRQNPLEGQASGVGATVLRWPELATPVATVSSRAECLSPARCPGWER